MKNESQNKERTIKQLRLLEETLTHQFQIEKEKIDKKNLNNEKNLNERIDTLEQEKLILNDKYKSVEREYNMLKDKIKNYSDYYDVKRQYDNLNEKLIEYQTENKNLKLQIANMQKQAEKLIETIASETKKYDSTKLELEELRAISQESKDDLNKALEEMEGYAQLLSAFEEKIRIAEEGKKAAEKERDDAYNDVKVIRQRYINILDNEKAFN